MDINPLIESASRMQKKLILASLVGVIPSYFVLFMKFDKFRTFDFMPQIMLSLMASSSCVVLYLAIVFITDWIKRKEYLTANFYEMCCMQYVSAYLLLDTHFYDNGVAWGFFSGVIAIGVFRFVAAIKCRIKRTTKDGVNIKTNHGYIDNGHYPKEN